MIKLVLILLSSCVGAIGFSELQRTAARNREAKRTTQLESDSVTNQLGEMEQEIAAARAEVLEKKDRLQEAGQTGQISAELLGLLEKGAGNAVAWAELRQQLGIGWDSSSEYVLVGKRVLKQLDYQRLESGARASDTACGLLGLSPEEGTALEAIFDRARHGDWLRVQRAEPAADVVAQYTVSPPDPVLVQSQSNVVFTEITGLLGAERVDFLLPDAWRQFASDLAPAKSQTMTIRRTVADGVPDLICDMEYGDQTASSPVRYAHYPSGWFLKLFPGGWQTLAEREGFDLPEKFRQ